MTRYLLWIILFILFCVRVIYFYQTQPSYPNDTKIRITDRITSEPIRYSNSQYIKLQGFKIYLPHYPEIYYGDRVVIEGKVQDDKLIEVRLVDKKEDKGFLYNFRRELLGFYQKSLPQPHSALIAGVTIGSKSNLGNDFWEALKKTGTAHVVVASGMNVTLVAKFLIATIVVFLPRKRAIPLALAGVWGYALLSGFEAPIIRAAVMGSITFASQEIGRLYYAWRALLISAFGMLFIRPEWITDVGFILSFAATASLMLFEAKVRKFIKFVPSIIREDFSTSLAAQVGVAPVLFVTFGQFNILSPIINAVVLWTIVPMTIIGMVSGIIGLIFEQIGTLILWLAYPLTSWFILVVGTFS